MQEYNLSIVHTLTGLSLVVRQEYMTRKKTEKY